MIILGLVARRAAVDDESAQLYVYAGVDRRRHGRAGPAARSRGCAGSTAASRSVIDWRDPAVRGCFVLMLPVTLDARADQRQRGDRHALRVAPHRPGARAGRDRQGVPPLHAPAGDLLRRRRDGALPDALAARRARRHGRLPAHASTTGCARSRSCSSRRALVSAVLAEPITRLVYQRGEFTAERDARSSRSALAAFSIGLVFNGLDADAEPRVLRLQSNWIPTGRRARQPRAQRACSTSRFYRVGVWGIPLATSIVERRRRRSCSSCCCGAGSGSST